MEINQYMTDTELQSLSRFVGMLERDFPVAAGRIDFEVRVSDANGGLFGTVKVHEGGYVFYLTSNTESDE